MQAMDMRTQKLTKALFRAILCEDVDSIATFLKQGADINAKLIDDCWNSPLHKAAEGNKLHSLVLLLKNGADISPFNTKGETPFLSAVRRGHMQCAEILANGGSPINGSVYMLYNPPLSVAAKNGHKELVIFLLSKDADPNGRDHLGIFDSTALHHAAQLGDAEMMKRLLDASASVDILNEWGETPLHLAAEAGHKECVEILTENGSSTQIQNFKGMTPLHKAARKGKFECVESLVDFDTQHDLSIDPKDNEGDTPLHAAIKNNQGSCAAFLLKNYATVETRDWNGNTPLHSAAASGNAHLVEFIISLHPHYPITMLNKNGDTALHLAAHVGSAPCVEVLLKYGAPINPLNMKGRSPKEEAAHMGHAKVVKLLSSFGAKRRDPLKSEIPEGLMATNFSNTLLSQATSGPPKNDTPNYTPALSMGLAQTLGHFQTLLAPPKVKPKTRPKVMPKTGPPGKKKKSPLPASLAPKATSKKSVVSDKPDKTVAVGDKNGAGSVDEYGPGSAGEEDESFGDEESDTTAGVNLDYSVSDLDDEDDSSVISDVGSLQLDDVANLQLGRGKSDVTKVRMERETSDGGSLQLEPEMTSRSVRPVLIQPKDDSVDLIAEIVIKKL